MARWIGVAHRAQVAMAREAGIVAFSHGREAAVRRLTPGNRVVYYAPRSDFDGEPVQAFVAHATVTGDAPFRTQWREDFTAWVRQAEFDPVRDVPVRSLLEHLSFVKNKRHWGMAFRNGKFEISDADYELIARALLPGDG